MATPPETDHRHWTRRLIEPSTEVVPVSDGGVDRDVVPEETMPKDSTPERIVPRARCRDCAERPGVRGLCVECLLK